MTPARQTTTVSLASTLFVRDFLRFKVERSRWLGAVLQPLLFWAMMGFGMGKNFSVNPASTPLMGSSGGDVAIGAGSSSYVAYFFPGSLVLVSLFTTMFASMSIIEDRNEGFLQSLLVRPNSRQGILFGKVASILCLTLLQSALFLCASPLAGVSLRQIDWVNLLACVSFGTIGLCLFSLTFAWKINSIAGYHSIMALILFPLWVFSGAFFPMDQAWQKVVATINPLSYFVEGVRAALSAGSIPVGLHIASETYLRLGILLLFSFAGYFLFLRLMNKTQINSQ